MGRPAKKLDLEQAEKLAMLQCTDVEMAAYFGVHVRTIENRRKSSAAFREACERGAALGRISVRRAQIELMKKGSAAMAIWLGKQLLGQRDVTASEVTGAGGGPQEHRIVVEYARIPPKTPSPAPGTGAGEE